MLCVDSDCVQECECSGFFRIDTEAEHKFCGFWYLFIVYLRPARSNSKTAARSTMADGVNFSEVAKILAIIETDVTSLSPRHTIQLHRLELCTGFFTGFSFRDVIRFYAKYWLFQKAACPSS